MEKEQLGVKPLVPKQPHEKMCACMAVQCRRSVSSFFKPSMSPKGKLIAKKLIAKLSKFG